jgi:hypothetical protein
MLACADPRPGGASGQSGGRRKVSLSESENCSYPAYPHVCLRVAIDSLTAGTPTHRFQPSRGPYLQCLSQSDRPVNVSDGDPSGKKLALAAKTGAISIFMGLAPTDDGERYQTNSARRWTAAAPERRKNKRGFSPGSPLSATRQSPIHQLYTTYPPLRRGKTRTCGWVRGLQGRAVHPDRLRTGHAGKSSGPGLLGEFGRGERLPPERSIFGQCRDETSS